MPAESGLVFNVSTLLTEPLGSAREYPVEGATFRCGAGHTPVAGQVRFMRTDGSVLVEAALALEVEEVCGRCLAPFRQALSVDLREEFWPEYDPLSRQHVEVPEGREGFPIVEGLLDLREALRQYVEMARPMQPICRAACAAPDDPPADERAEPPPDHRWAALEELREELR